MTQKAGLDFSKGSATSHQGLILAQTGSLGEEQAFPTLHSWETQTQPTQGPPRPGSPSWMFSPCLVPHFRLCKLDLSSSGLAHGCQAVILGPCQGYKYSLRPSKPVAWFGSLRASNTGSMFKILPRSLLSPSRDTPLLSISWLEKLRTFGLFTPPFLPFFCTCYGACFC